jgi:hypothetical protein
MTDLKCDQFVSGHISVLSMTVAADERRKVAGVLKGLYAKQVEIILRLAYGIATNPLRRRAGDTDVLHHPAFEVFSGGR